MILFYGCWTTPAGVGLTGHYFFLPDGRTQVRHHRRNGAMSDNPETLIPWGYKVDGNFAPRGAGAGRVEAPNGVAGYHIAVSWVGHAEEEAWSLISWWDNSVDIRGGSSASFMVDRRATPEEILAEAREKFPQIFARFKYEIVLPKALAQEAPRK